MTNLQVLEEEKGKEYKKRIFFFGFSQTFAKQHQRGNHAFFKSATHPNYQGTQSTCVGYTIKFLALLNYNHVLILTIFKDE